MQNNKAFYSNALTATGQNSFSECLYNFTHEQIISLCLEACGNRTIDKADLDFIVDFLGNAFFGVLLTWVKSDMKESPDLIVKRLECLVDKSTERLLANLHA
jgi:hypothetical protein